MQIKKEGDTFFIAGVIDENCTLTDLEPSGQTILKLNFKGVTKINSIGVREWMRIITLWKDKSIEYHECSTSIVDQLMIVRTLRGAQGKIATVESALLPIECSKCGYEGEVLASRNDYVVNQSLSQIDRKCKNCGHSCDFLHSDFAPLFSK